MGCYGLVEFGFIRQPCFSKTEALRIELFPMGKPKLYHLTLDRPVSVVFLESDAVFIACTAS